MGLFTLFARLVAKRSAVAGKVPTKDDLVIGELAVNLADRALYTKINNEEVVRLNPDPKLNSEKITDLKDIL